MITTRTLIIEHHPAQGTAYTESVELLVGQENAPHLSAPTLVVNGAVSRNDDGSFSGVHERTVDLTDASAIAFTDDTAAAELVARLEGERDAALQQLENVRRERDAASTEKRSISDVLKRREKTPKPNTDAEEAS